MNEWRYGYMKELVQSENRISNGYEEMIQSTKI
jgi:hypothetical protein